jgi:hypothetical protein
MTIFDHIENIKNQCEFLLKELEKEQSETEKMSEAFLEYVKHTKPNNNEKE